MRKQAAGLSEIVQTSLGQNPCGELLFIFCNKRRDIMKALYFDRAGFCLWTKRLDQSRFPWLKSASRTYEITAADLELVFDGVDVFKRHKELKFNSVS